MKCALLLEEDEASRAKTANVLKWLGYIVVAARSPHAALHATGSIRFDLILTCTAIIPNDRRSLTGELKRAAPNAAIILIAGEDQSHFNNYAGVNSVIRRPATLDALRKVIEYQLDYELQPASLLTKHERRHTSVRRYHIRNC